MSLPQFAWVTLSDLETVRRQLPASRQAGARNAVLAMAEAASRRRDGQHADGYTLEDLVAVAGVSGRRLRDHLQDLATVDVISIERPRDAAGRSLPTRYTFARADESSVPDKASDRADESGDASSDRVDRPADDLASEVSDPTRARDTGEEEEARSSLRSHRARKPDDTQPPEDFPPELRAPLDQVLEVLQRIAEARGSSVVTVLATARAIAAYPKRPHLQAALDLEHWLVHGTGRRNKPKDVVGYYRNQLRDRWQDQAAPPHGQLTAETRFSKYDIAGGLAPSTPNGERRARSDENLAALNRLMDPAAARRAQSIEDDAALDRLTDTTNERRDAAA